MQALLVCEEKLDKKVKGHIESYIRDSLIIVTENEIYREIKAQYPEVKVQLLDINSEDFFAEEEALSYLIVEDLEKVNKYQRLKNFPYITINSIFAVYTRIAVNVNNKLDTYIKKFNIDKVVLLGGNKKVPFLGFNLAEGERPFRFLYRREWFLNHIVYQLYLNKIKIEWRRQESFLFLYFIRAIRIKILNIGKLLKCTDKIIKSKKNCNEVKKEDVVLIVVRTRTVVEAMVPLYKELKKRDKCKPLVLVYENYGNSGVIEEVQKKGMDFVDLRGCISLIDVWKSYFGIYSKKCNSQGEILLHMGEDKTLKIDRKIISKELGVQWWEALLLESALQNFRNKSEKNILCLINAETNNWVAATQALWAKKHSILSIGLQFVTLSLRPVTSWVDMYFLMSMKGVQYMLKNRPREKYLYAGPVCYDFIFGISEHNIGKLENIVVFTQPDFLRNDAFRMIDDLIYLRKSMNQKWKILIKLHPREKDKNEFVQKYKKYSFISVIHKEKNSTELLENADLAVGISSTTLQQAVIAGTPAVSVDYDNLNKYLLEVVQHGVVCRVTSTEKLCNYLKNFKEFDNLYEKNRRDYLDQYMDKYDGNGAGIVVDYIEKAVLECENIR